MYGLQMKDSFICKYRDLMLKIITRYITFFTFHQKEKIENQNSAFLTTFKYPSFDYNWQIIYNI